MDLPTPLRLAIAARYNPEARRQWRELAAAAPVDWPRLVGQAVAAGLAPLLHDSLRQPYSPPVSDDLRRQLHAHYRRTALHNTLALNELGAVLAMLAGAEIPVIVLKGAALAQAVYGNVALRPMVDLDILIPFAALERARRCLAQLDFTVHHPLPFQDKSGLCWNELILKKPGLKATYLELHWHLLDNPYYARAWPAAGIWQRARPLEIEGVRAHILSAEDQILHLCAHNFFHHRNRLAQVGPDLAEALQWYGDALDWNRFITMAQESGLVLAARETLTRAATEWYLPLPEGTLDALAGGAHWRERFFAASQGSEFMKIVRTAVTLPRFSLTMRYLWGQLFPDRQYLAWRYGLDAETSRAAIYLARFKNAVQHLYQEVKA